jgi:hypothetical protein
MHLLPRIPLASSTLSAILLAFALGCSSTGTPSAGSPGDDASAGSDGTSPGVDSGTLPGADASADAPNNGPDTGSPPSSDGSTDDASSGDGGSPGAMIPGWPPADAAAVAPPDWGSNVLIFDPSMPASTIQSQLDTVATAQNAPSPPGTTGAPYGAEYSTSRYAYFFKPGQYNADVKIGFYIQALGLGHSPDDVTITGAVRSKADWRQDDPGDALLNFWRGAENVAVVPTLAADSQIDVWAVSQATHLRRIHVMGSMVLSDGGYSSGGFIADSQIDSQISSGTQQQFFTRNTNLTSWKGGSWNMVFVGDGQTPSGNWPSSPYTVIPTTPVVREKPFVFVESNGNYYVMVPALKSASQGPSWSSSAAPGYSLPIDQFYLAHQGTDTAATMNAALSQGKHLLLTPGIYHLSDSIQVTRPNTLVLGLGFATLVPDNGTSTITVADVDGVTVAGLILDANTTSSPTLLQLGDMGSSQDHSKNPSAIFDVHCRIGGAIPGTASSCITINSSDVILDNSWLWRSDDGAGVGWTQNMSDSGIVVNGDRVTAYGLFVEHFQKYQTMWNGNGGSLFFYQSELPYDVPDQTSWSHNGVNGYASYKVADTVTTHNAQGMGVYCVFDNAITSENAVETPTAAGVSMQHIVTTRWGGANGSGINHIINGTGGAVDSSHMSARTPN